jgi:hypothetical protein
MIQNLIKDPSYWEFGKNQNKMLFSKPSGQPWFYFKKFIKNKLN